MGVGLECASRRGPKSTNVAWLEAPRARPKLAERLHLGSACSGCGSFQNCRILRSPAGSSIVGKHDGWDIAHRDLADNDFIEHDPSEQTPLRIWMQCYRKRFT